MARSSSWSHSRPGWTSGCIIIGIHRSGASPTVSPKKPGGQDADDLERSLAEGDDFPEHIGAAREAAVPKIVADDGVGRVVRGAVVGLGEDAADDGLHAQDVEVGAADQAGVHVLGGAAIYRSADAIGVALRGIHIGEHLLPVADVLVLAIAEQRAGGALGPDGDSVDGSR